MFFFLIKDIVHSTVGKISERLTLRVAAVDAGHRAVIFDRFRGVQDTVANEGTHFLIPWVQKPIIFDCRSRPRNVPVITGSKGKRDCPQIRRRPHFCHKHSEKTFRPCVMSQSFNGSHGSAPFKARQLNFFPPADLQNVNITLRILFRPMTAQLPRIFTSIGEDYDERVLPSITTEVLKAVVVSVNSYKS